VIGTVTRNRSFVSLYSMVVWSHLALNIISGAYFIYTLFHKVSEDDLNNCIASYEGDLISQFTCAKEFEIYRHVIITIYLVIVLFELCASSSLSASPPLPQSFTTACDRICLLIMNRCLSRRRQLYYAASGRGGAGLSATRSDGCCTTFDGDDI
jgi:hypothetical protein